MAAVSGPEGIADNMAVGRPEPGGCLGSWRARIVAAANPAGAVLPGGARRIASALLGRSGRPGGPGRPLGAGVGPQLQRHAGHRVRQ